MAILVGENSWATIAEANAYFTSRPGSSNWFALEDVAVTPGGDSKEGFLITAFYWLTDDSFGLTGSSGSVLVRRAQFEAAIFLLNYSRDYYNRQALEAGGVTSFMASRWTENLSKVTKPSNVTNILYSGNFSSGNTFVQLTGETYE
jgi:hypothetical protein